MLIQRRIKKKDIIEYALIIALFYVTGGAFSYTNYSMQVILLFSCSLGLAIVLGCINHFFQKKVLIVWGIQFICLILVPVLYEDSISSYIAIVLQISIGAFCATIIPWQNFKEKFLKVIVFFAAISLLFFVVSMIYPQVALLFPKIIGAASVDYYNAFIYVFMQPKNSGVDFSLSIRNSGICWEPGCYQAFLNIGLIFLLEFDEKHEKRQMWSFMILLIAIFTTMSTTGLILLACTLLIYFPIWTRRFIGVKNFFIGIVSLIAFFYLMKNLEFTKFIIEKIEREFLSLEDGNALDRISLNRIFYVFADENFYFFGMSFAKWLTYDVSLWNSVIHSILCLGTPFTIVQLSLYWKGANTLGKKGYWLFIVMVLCCFTETLFWRVFFNTIAYYGVVHQKGNK